MVDMSSAQEAVARAQQKALAAILADLINRNEALLKAIVAEDLDNGASTVTVREKAGPGVFTIVISSAVPAECLVDE